MNAPPRLSFWHKLVYGSGDWGGASYGTLRQIFYAIFLTDVVGLEPRLASVAALVGILWDAINDPLIGTLTDRTHTRWGRRRPFLLLFALPFGAGFLLLWWAPPWESQIALAVTITLAFMISDTLETLVGIPFASLLPEISPGYDDRTTLTGYRIFFNLLASLVTAVAAPAIVDAALAAGWSQQQGYLLVAGLFGFSSAIPFIVIALVIREKFSEENASPKHAAFKTSVMDAWKNIPFRFAASIYMLNWITFDLIAMVLPFYLLYWIASGDRMSSVTFIGLELPLESAVFALLLLTAVIALPIWMLLSRWLGKHIAYVFGMIFWVGVQIGIFFLQPGQINLVLWMAFLAGLSVSAAHILPDALFPDVIEWDELRTGRRQEGIYYGVKNFIRKLTGALAIFIALQVLGWFGYQSPPDGMTVFHQPPQALLAIRLLIGPVGGILLFSTIAVTWFYPLTRARHDRIRKLLARKAIIEDENKGRLS